MLTERLNAAQEELISLQLNLEVKERELAELQELQRSSDRSLSDQLKEVIRERDYLRSLNSELAEKNKQLKESLDDLINKDSISTEKLGECAIIESVSSCADCPSCSSSRVGGRFVLRLNTLFSAEIAN